MLLWKCSSVYICEYFLSCSGVVMTWSEVVCINTACVALQIKERKSGTNKHKCICNPRDASRRAFLNCMWQHTLVTIILLLSCAREHKYAPFFFPLKGLLASWTKIVIFLSLYWCMFFIFWWVCDDPLGIPRLNHCILDLAWIAF